MMQRYTAYVFYENHDDEDDVTFVPKPDGAWVPHSEASAEIERLEKEVEIHKRGSLGNSLQRDIAQSQRDTAWNDAIEAAAKSASEWWAYLHDDQDRDGPVASAIRALKRPTPDAPSVEFKSTRTDEAQAADRRAAEEGSKG
jgi:hypothetical protein